MERPATSPNIEVDPEAHEPPASVPLLDLTRTLEPDRDALTAAFARILDSGHYIMGPDLSAFERECADWLGVAHGLAVSSGTDALLLALMGLRIGPGDEVLVPSFTFFATAGCVHRLGARPVFVDSLPASFNLDPDDLERKITPNTKAVIPVHLFGQAAEMDRIIAIARRHHLHVIDDAAQAIGAQAMVDGNVAKVGSFGTVGCFSFFPTKNLGCFGDGGFVSTNDADLCERMSVLRVHGGKPKYVHGVVGANFRMDTVQAAWLRIRLPRLDALTLARQDNAEYYQRAFLDAGIGSIGPADADTLRLPQQTAANHTYNQFVVRVPARIGRDALRQRLTEARIGTEVYYPIPLHRQECFASVAGDAHCPVAEELAADVLALPIFPGLTKRELDHVIDSIVSVFASS